MEKKSRETLRHSPYRQTDDSRESAFLIQDIFPITEEYMEREPQSPETI